VNCSCSGNWSCLSVSAPYSREDREEQRGSQDRRLNGMLKCQGLERGLVVPQVRAATVRLRCLIPCWCRQKESRMKNAAGASRGTRKATWLSFRHDRQPAPLGGKPLLLRVSRPYFPHSPHDSYQWGIRE